MNEEIKRAIEILNKNGYVVAKVNKAQMSMAQTCSHNKDRCDFNLLGIKCVDLLCIQDMIKEQVLPYVEADGEDS